MDREQLVRERAYLIWQEEGCPSGCEQEHWDRAVREIEDQQAAPSLGAPSDATGTVPEAAPAPVPIVSGTASESPAAAAATTRPKRTAKVAAKAPATRSPKGKAGKKPA